MAIYILNNRTKKGFLSRHRMDRLKPERAPRQRIQTVWRNVTWADAFSDDSLIMDTIDITPDFALRKITLLFENKKYEECAGLIRRLNELAVGAILSEVPIEVLHEALPQSICILEALYLKVFQSCETNFPLEQMKTEQLIKQIVCLFAKDVHTNSNGAKNCNMFLPSCRTILRIVMTVEPEFRHHIVQRKKVLDHCMKRLAKHGMVDSSGGNYMYLHDALKLEFEKVITQLKCAIQKLEQLSLATKHPTSTSLTSGKAPICASHQRLMQVTRSDVQDRVIKNKTLYNIVEPAIKNQYLNKLIRVLCKRIEYDKVMLFHDTELRKMAGLTDDDTYLSVTLRQFSQGYTMMLQLLKEISGDEAESKTDSGTVSSSDDENDDDDDDEELKSHMRNEKLVSMNGNLPARSHHDTVDIRKIQPVKEVSEEVKRNRREADQVLNSGNGWFVLDSDGTALRQDRHAGLSLTYHSKGAGPLSDFPRYSGLSSMMRPSSFTLSSRLDRTTLFSRPASVLPNGENAETLKMEISRLKEELHVAKDEVKRLLQREQMLKERLSDNICTQFNLNSGNFENLSLGDKRPSELIHKYGNLYTEGRMDAMDALNRLPELTDLDILKMKILFSVIVLCFRSVQQSIQELRGKLRHLLHLPVPRDAEEECADRISTDMEKHITFYLQQTTDRFDLSANAQEVCSQIYATLFDYPCLKACPPLIEYIKECLSLAWALSVQKTPFIIVYDSRTFSDNLHIRFHTSDPNENRINCFLWPCLMEGQNGACVYKGVVIT